MPQCRCFLGKIQEVPYKNVNQDAKVISIEILVSRWSRKYKVEEF